MSQYQHQVAHPVPVTRNPDQSTATGFTATFRVGTRGDKLRPLDNGSGDTERSFGVDVLDSSSGDTDSSLGVDIAEGMGEKLTVKDGVIDSGESLDSSYHTGGACCVGI